MDEGTEAGIHRSSRHEARQETRAEVCRTQGSQRQNTTDVSRREGVMIAWIIGTWLGLNVLVLFWHLGYDLGHKHGEVATLALLNKTLRGKNGKDSNSYYRRER